LKARSGSVADRCKYILTLVRSRRRGNVGQAEDGVLHPRQHDRSKGKNKQPYQDRRSDPHTKAAVIIERNHEK
jgi:hypothetical protein